MLEIKVWNVRKRSITKVLKYWELTTIYDIIFFDTAKMGLNMAMLLKKNIMSILGGDLY
jgi:hypothetical protein